jgi:biopolymer transport protein ExbD
MTPMVDLAFLLLTFFMLTTTFAKSRAMQLTMPVADDVHPHEVPSSSAMTIVLGKQHRVHYYFGLNNPADPTVVAPKLYTTDFGPQGIRHALLTRNRQQPAPIILIKPSAQADYQDMIDILDEMNITNSKKYALVKITPPDTKLLQQAGY